MSHNKETINRNISKVRCYLFKDDIGYDLNPLRSPNDQNYDKNVTLPGNNLLFYNFCRNTLTTCRGKSSLMYVSGNNSSNTNSSCKIVSDAAEVFNTWEIKESSTNSQYIEIKYSNGESCSSGKSFSISMTLNCNKEGKNGEITFSNLDKFDANNCENTIVASSIHACTQEGKYIVTAFLSKFFFVFGPLLIFSGLFLLAFGSRFKLLSGMVVAVIVLFLISLVAFVPFIKTDNILLLWGVFGGCIFMAAPFALLFYQLDFLFNVFLGGLMGFVIGLFFYYITFLTIEEEQSLIFWILISLFIVIFAVLGPIFRKHILIIFTSIIGSYSLVKGINLLVGGFPNEMLLKDLFLSKEKEQLSDLINYKLYLYLFGMVISLTLGIILQYNISSTEQESKGESKYSSKSTERTRRLTRSKNEESLIDYLNLKH